MASSFGSLISGVAGGTVGGAVVKLYLDDKQYQEGLAEAEAKGATATSSIGGSFSKMKALGVAAFAALGVALVKFGIDSIKAAEESAAMQLKLANAVQNSTNVNADAIPVFQAQAQAIRDVTGVDDDYINANQAMLVTMGLTQDQITQLTPLIVDLAAKGFSMEAATKAVGKAVNGTIGGLSRMGVVVDKDAAASDAFGATLKALGVNAGLAEQQAKAEPWRILSMQFQELEETVGKLLLPVLRALAEGLITVVGALKYTAPAAIAVAAALAVAEIGFDGVAIAAMLAADAMVPLFVAIAPVVAALGLLYIASKILTDGVHGLEDAIKGTINEALGPVVQAAQLAQRAHISLADALVRVTDEQKKAAAATDDGTRAFNDMKAAEQALAGGLTGLIGSVIKLRRDQAALNQLRKDGKQGTKEYTDAELNLLNDQISVNSAFREYAGNLREAGKSQDQARNKLEALGAKVGLTASQVDALITKLGLYGQKLDDLNGKQVDISVVTHYYSDHVNDNGGTPHGSLLGGPPGGGGHGGTKGSGRFSSDRAVADAVRRELQRTGAV